MGRLDGKVALVTGGSSWIGKAIALLYAKEGADVIIISRKEEALKEVCKLNEKKNNLLCRWYNSRWCH